MEKHYLVSLRSNFAAAICKTIRTVDRSQTEGRTVDDGGADRHVPESLALQPY
jgi:hypothetical protein